jgi:hypothetical protein
MAIKSKKISFNFDFLIFYFNFFILNKEDNSESEILKQDKLKKEKDKN